MPASQGPLNFQRLLVDVFPSAASKSSSKTDVPSVRSFAVDKNLSCVFCGGMVNGTPSWWNFSTVRVWSEAELKSVTCSIESMCLTRIRGVLERVVLLRGSGLLKPQSPRRRDDGYVVTVWYVGKT